jgi:hypothetical protein
MLLAIILALIVGGVIVAIALTCFLTAGEEVEEDTSENDPFPK